MALQDIIIRLKMAATGVDQQVRNSAQIADNYARANTNAQRLGATQARAAAAAGSRNTREMMDYTTAGGITGRGGANARDFANQAQGLGGLVRLYATVAANVFALTAAFGALSRAMDTTNMIAGLDVLGASSGRALGALSKQLAQVSDGAISMREAMQATAMSSSAGMTNQQILRMGEVAKNASLALGVSMPDAMSRLSRGIVKLEPELLDELGIFTKIEPAVEAYALRLGKAATSLTDFERRQAFANAVLKEGEDKFSAISDEINSNPYNKLSASLQNVTQQGLELINKVLAPLADLLSKSPTVLIGGLLLLTSTLIKQALPAITQYRESLDAERKKAQDLVAKKKEDTLAAGQALGELASRNVLRNMEANAESELRVFEQKEKRLRELKKQGANFSTELNNLLKKDIHDISKQEVDAAKAVAVHKLQIARDNHKAAVAFSGMITPEEEEKYKRARDAAQAELHTVRALERTIGAEQAYTTARQAGIAVETDRLRLGRQFQDLVRAEEKMVVQAKRSEILANMAYNTSLVGIIDAFKIMRAEAEAAGNVGSRFTLGLRAGIAGIGALITRALGAIGTIIQAITAAVAVFGLIDAALSKNTKETQRFDDAIDNSESSIKAITNTIETYQKRNEDSIKSTAALATAFGELSDSMEVSIKRFEKMMLAAGPWDRFWEDVKSAFGYGRADTLAETLANQLYGALDVAERFGQRDELTSRLKEYLQIENIFDEKAFQKAIRNLDEAGRKGLARITDNFKTRFQEIGSTLSAFEENLDKTYKSFQEFSQSLAPTDQFSKLAESFGRLALSMIEVSQLGPGEQLKAFEKLMKNPEKLALLGDNFRVSFFSMTEEFATQKIILDSYTNAISEMTKTISKYKQEIAKANESPFLNKAKQTAQVTQVAPVALLPGVAPLVATVGIITATFEKIENFFKVRRLTEKSEKAETTLSALEKGRQEVAASPVFERANRLFAETAKESLEKAARYTAMSLQNASIRAGNTIASAYAAALSGPQAVAEQTRIAKSEQAIKVREAREALNLLDSQDSLVATIKENTAAINLNTEAQAPDSPEKTERMQKMRRAQMEQQALSMIMAGKKPEDVLSILGADPRGRGVRGDSDAQRAFEAAQAQIKIRNMKRDQAQAKVTQEEATLSAIGIKGEIEKRAAEAAQQRQILDVRNSITQAKIASLEIDRQILGITTKQGVEEKARLESIILLANQTREVAEINRRIADAQSGEKAAKASKDKEREGNYAKERAFLEQSLLPLILARQEEERALAAKRAKAELLNVELEKLRKIAEVEKSNADLVYSRQEAALEISRAMFTSRAELVGLDKSYVAQRVHDFDLEKNRLDLEKNAADIRRKYKLQDYEIQTRITNLGVDELNQADDLRKQQENLNILRDNELNTLDVQNNKQKQILEINKNQTLEQEKQRRELEQLNRELELQQSAVQKILATTTFGEVFQAEFRYIAELRKIDAQDTIERTRKVNAFIVEDERLTQEKLKILRDLQETDEQKQATKKVDTDQSQLREGQARSIEELDARRNTAKQIAKDTLDAALHQARFNEETQKLNRQLELEQSALQKILATTTFGEVFQAQIKYIAELKRIDAQEDMNRTRIVDEFRVKSFELAERKIRLSQMAGLNDPQDNDRRLNAITEEENRLEQGRAKALEQTDATRKNAKQIAKDTLDAALNQARFNEETQKLNRQLELEQSALQKLLATTTFGEVFQAQIKYAAELKRIDAQEDMNRTRIVDEFRVKSFELAQRKINELNKQATDISQLDAITEEENRLEQGYAKALEQTDITRKNAKQIAKDTLDVALHQARFNEETQKLNRQLELQQSALQKLLATTTFSETFQAQIKYAAELKRIDAQEDMQRTRIVDEFRVKSAELAERKIRLSQMARLNDPQDNDRRLNAITEEENRLEQGRAKALEQTDATRNAAKQLAKDTLDTALNQAKFNEQMQRSVDLANGIKGAFKGVGDKIGELIISFTEYSQQQERNQTTLTAAIKKREEAEEKLKKLGFGDSSTEAAKELNAAETEVDKQRKKSVKDQLASQEKLAANTKAVFKEKTAAYKAFYVVEKTLHAMRMAMAAIQMATDIKAAITAMTSTGAQVAADGTKAASGGVVAVINAIKDLPFPVNIAAGVATAAFVASVIGKVIGGGGKTAFVPTAQQRQEVQSTAMGYDKDGKKVQVRRGVFGDEDAKNESIANSINIIKENSVDGLSYDNKMLKYLESIDRGINNSARSLYTIKGLRSGSISGTVEGTQGGGFLRSKTTRTITDSGLLIEGTFAQLASDTNKAVIDFVEQVTVKKKNWYGRTKTSIETNRKEIDNTTSNFFRDIFSNATNLIKETATQARIGLDKVDQILGSMRLDNYFVSLRGLKGEEFQTELQAVISSIIDDASEAVFKSFTAFAKFGEGMLETVVRVIDTNKKIIQAIKNVGIDFETQLNNVRIPKKILGVTVGSDTPTPEQLQSLSYAFTENMIEMAGGLEEFLTQTDYFIENFLSDAEKLAPKQKTVREELTRLGYASVTTTQQFKQIVLGLDLTTQSGRNTRQALMNIQEAFIDLYKDTEDLLNNLKKETAELNSKLSSSDSVIANIIIKTGQYIEKLKASGTATIDNIKIITQWGKASALKELRNNFKAAFEERKRELESNIDGLKKFKNALIDLKNSLNIGELSTLTPLEQYNDLLSQYRVALANVRSSDTAVADAAKQAFPQLAQQLLRSGRELYASSNVFTQLSNRVNTDISDVQQYLDNQISDQEALLKALEDDFKPIFTDIANNTLSASQKLQEAYTLWQTYSNLDTNNLATLITTNLSKIDNAILAVIGAFKTIGLTDSFAAGEQALAETGSMNIFSEILTQLVVGFDKLDTNLDGKVTKQELKDAFVETGLLNDNDITTLIAALDFNTDNMIDGFEIELAKVITKLGTVSVDILRGLSTGFNDIDTNLDGKVSEQEFKTAFYGKTSDNNLQRLFQLFDTDNDSIISANEAQALSSYSNAQLSEQNRDLLRIIYNNGLLGIEANTNTSLFNDTILAQILDRIAQSNEKMAETPAPEGGSTATSVKAAGGQSKFEQLATTVVAGAAIAVGGYAAWTYLDLILIPFLFGSDARAKKNIKHAKTLSNGINLYDFNYKEPYSSMYGTNTKRGVLAQEVEQKYPEAVYEDTKGMKMVDYAALPISSNELKFRALGGPVTSNMPYIVGEVGPELFVPNNSGTIVPNNQLTFDNKEIVAKLDQLIQAVSKGAVINVQATKENTECIEQAIISNTNMIRTQNRVGIK